jgi:hypothetical protein
LIGRPFHPDLRAINALTTHAVSHQRLVHNHASCKQNELDTAWNRRFSGSAEADKGRREGEKDVFLQTLTLMGDWCRQDGHRKRERNYGKGKEVDDSRSFIVGKKEVEPSVSMGEALLSTKRGKQLRLLQ